MTITRFNSRHIDRALRKLDADVVERSGSIKFQVKFQGEKIFPPIVFPKTGRDLPQALYRQLLRSLAIEHSDFDDLISCRLSGDGYFELRGIKEHNDWLNKPIEIETLVGLDGLPLQQGQLVPRHSLGELQLIDAVLFHEIKDNPSIMYDFSFREFEVFVSALLNRRGYETKLTPPSGDGGKDILASKSTEFGSQLFLVEAKRYAPTRPVGVGIVRQLYGVVEDKRATGGLVVTTSRFTKGARDFQQRNKYRMNLADYQEIIRWVSKVS
ncbi:restriction endonuclease [Ruegeria atlantica]|uniref:restriction endonuclease n=1 Tax=Ruegeria atlantica TaxID=81569 RepID=UPI00147BB4BC|nr:restriction endonuclease [Ruegeria atlantica]